MSTPPTSTPWVPIWPKKGFESIVDPPQDGKWAQGSDGKVIWVPTPTGFQDTGWHIFGQAGQPAFQNGCTHYASATYGPARFRKLSDNLVIMEGLITVPTASVVVFQMPVGYRPMILSGGDYISHRLLSQSSTPYAWGSGHFYADGRFVPQTGGGNWISLSNFRYYAE